MVPTGSDESKLQGPFQDQISHYKDFYVEFHNADIPNTPHICGNSLLFSFWEITSDNCEAICGLCRSFGGGIKDAVWCPAAVMLAACGFSSSGCLHYGGGAAYIERLVSTEAEIKMLWINFIYIHNCRMLWYEIDFNKLMFISPLMGICHYEGWYF